MYSRVFHSLLLNMFSSISELDDDDWMCLVTGASGYFLTIKTISDIKDARKIIQTLRQIAHLRNNECEWLFVSATVVT